MVDFFGDEFIIESYKIPWLIWIQLLVTILLIILLFFGFTIFTSDPTSSSSSAAAAAPPNQIDKPASSRSQRRDKVVEEHKATRDSGTCGGSIREDNEIGEGSSMKEPMEFRSFRFPNHPCNYIGLARRALLKCFGLDAPSESSSNHQHDKQE